MLLMGDRRDRRDGEADKELLADMNWGKWDSFKMLRYFADN
jgi:hypothetical protein